MGTTASAGGEASGAGEAGLPQHPQEADGMSAGPARRGCRQALGEVWQGSEDAGRAAGGGGVGNAALSLQKKLPLTTLAQCLMEGSAVLGDDSLLG